LRFIALASFPFIYYWHFACAISMMRLALTSTEFVTRAEVRQQLRKRKNRGVSMHLFVWSLKQLDFQWHLFLEALVFQYNLYSSHVEESLQFVNMCARSAAYVLSFWPPMRCVKDPLREPNRLPAVEQKIWVIQRLL
jgi:hypothetical protein